MPRAFLCAILMTIGQASVMASPSCTMDYFGEPFRKTKWSFLPEHRTSLSCWDACSQKLDTWGPLDWYFEEPTTDERIQSEKW